MPSHDLDGGANRFVGCTGFVTAAREIRASNRFPPRSPRGYVAWSARPMVVSFLSVLTMETSVKSVRTRTVAPVGTLLLALGTLAACSGDSDDTATTASQSGPDASTATATSSASPSTDETEHCRPSGKRSDCPIPKDYTLPQNIEPGTCYLLDTVTYDLSDTVEVDCSEPHYLEITATFTWPEAYIDAIGDQWGKEDSRCNDKLSEAMNRHGLVDDILGNIYTDVWAPSAMQMAAGERTGYCSLEPRKSHKLLVGSVLSDTFKID